MSEAVHKEKNVRGGELPACSYAPLTGYFRDGCCSTHGEDGVALRLRRYPLEGAEEARPAA